jgi:hypothetical protein
VGKAALRRAASPEDLFERQYHAAVSLGRVVATIGAAWKSPWRGQSDVKMSSQMP